MIKAKKYLGQHFLVNHGIKNKIMEKFLSLPQYFTIEIGAGTGILTQELIKNIPKDKFIAIDIDPDSIEFLKENYPECSHQFLLEDFLHSPYIEKILCENEVNIIGNFPYNISTQIMFKLLKHRKNVRSMVGMFQKEVAERICAIPGNKQYGILSVLLQTYFESQYLFTVSEGSFNPPPKVKSAVISLENKNANILDINEKLYFEIVKTAFQQRRKILRNSLKKWSTKIRLPYMDKRPEQLSYFQFIEITNKTDEFLYLNKSP